MRRIGWVAALWLVSSLALADEGDGYEAGESASSAEVAHSSGSGSASNGHEGDGSIKDRSVHASRPLGLSGMLYLPWYHGIGIGLNARVEIPVVKDGFIPQINDQFSIEPSFGIAYTSRAYAWGVFDERLKYLNITPAVYGVWSFHITPKFRPYAALGLGYNVGIWLNDDIAGLSGKNNHYFYWDTAVGLFYNFADSISLRAELGAQGPKVGLAAFF